MKIALDPFMHRHLSLEELPSKVAELGFEWIECGRYVQSQGFLGPALHSQSPGTNTRVHQHLNIGQGEVPWDDFFGTLAGIGFDGIMTACVFAWEDKADQSGKFMRSEMQRYIDTYWGAK